MRGFFFELIDTVMEKSLAEQFVDGYRYRFFLVKPSWTPDTDFFFTQRPILTSVVFLTLHDTLLTTRGRGGFIFLFSYFCDVLECR